MAWRPPSSAPSGTRRNNQNVLPCPERGGAHQLLSSSTSLPDPVQAKRMHAAGAFPPLEPIQRSYIPPSSQVQLDCQNLAPRNLSSHSSYNSSTPSNRSLPFRSPHQYQMTYNPPPGPYQPSTMVSTASTASVMAGTTPLWLEPNIQERISREDPFLSTKNSGLGPSSSQSRFATTKGNIMSSNPGPSSYASQTMGNYLPDIPSKETEDRYEIR